MLRKIYGTNFFHTNLLDHTNIKCQNGPVLPPAQVFYFNGQALNQKITVNVGQIVVFLMPSYFE
jgi:hypothetical protein